MSLRIGAHVDQVNPLEDAAARGADLVQLFLGDPQGWKKPTVAYEGGAPQLKADAESAGLGVYVHAPYVLNVATTNNRIRIPSRKLLQQTLDLAAAAGAAGVVVHGGHVGAGDDPRTGVDNWRKCVERVERPVPLLIENTAGGTNAMTRHLDRLELLWAAVGGRDGVGLCLDTCHAHAAGVELGGLVDKVRSVIGRVDLVHANDSRDAAGSGADRHANLGAGRLDPQELLAVVRDAGAPVVVETPGGVAGQGADIAWLRDQLAASR